MATHSYTHNRPNSAMPPPPTPPPPLPLRSIIHFLALLVTLFPTFLLMRLVGITSSTDTTSEFLTANLLPGANPIESQYRLLFTLEASRRRRFWAALASVSALIATLLIPFLRSSSFLTSPLYNWSFLAAVIFCGRYLLDATINSAVASLELRFSHRNKRWSYYAFNVCQPLGSVLHWTLILMTWRFLHFATVLYPITGYGAWAFGAWLIRCVLILMNEAVKARWRANAMYNKLEERILRVGFQIHILCRLIPNSAPNMSYMVVPWRKKEGEAETLQMASEADICCKVGDYIRYFSGYRVTTKDLEAIAKGTEAFTSMLPVDWASEMGEYIRVAQGISPDDGMHIDKRWLMEKFRLGDEDARVLYGELRALVNSPDEVSYTTFSLWMNLAYQENQEVGEKLRVEEDKIINSDRFLLAMLISKAFLLWLFLTGKSTTQVIVVIPFVYFAKCFIDELNMPHFRTLCSSNACTVL